MIELTTPVGRLVGGHPMVEHAVIDDRTKQPKMQKDGITPQMQTYVGLAIAKGAETHWNQTSWGQQIWQQGAQDHPNVHQSASYAWKITDGDSNVPNKRGNKPCDREGYPGHWVINATNGFPVKCFHRGQYAPHQAIQRKEAIKPGDYCRLVITVKGNGDSESPGVYVNPTLFELYQAGQEIILSTGPSAEETFGATEAALPAGALVDNNVQQPATAGTAPPPVQQQTAPPPVQQQQPGAGSATPPPPVQPHAAILQPVLRVHDGIQYTEEALRTAGWPEESIAALPKA